MSQNEVKLNAIPDWKLYLQLGEELIEQPSIKKQCDLIRKTIRNILDASSKVFLSGPYFPLPGELDYEVLPNIHTNKIIRTAFEKQLSIFRKGENVTIIEKIPLENPHKLAIPLVSQDNMLGILEVSRKKTSFSKDEIEFLVGLALHASVSMQIVRQVTIKNWHTEQLSLVRKVSEQIANVLDLQELCTRLTALIQETFNYYYVAIFLVNGKKRTLELKANKGAVPTAKLPQNYSVQMGEGIVGSVAKLGKELIAQNVKNENLYKEYAQLNETISEASFPIKINKKILGVLDIQSDQADGFHEYDIVVLNALANSIAIAVQDADLYGSLQRRADQMATIFEVSHAINSILNLDELLEKVINTLMSRFGNDEVHFFTVHPGRNKIFYQSGSGKYKTLYKDLSFNIEDSKSVISWVARNGISAISNDVSQDLRFKNKGILFHNNLSELIVPLQYGNEILGILDVQINQKNAFDEHDLFLYEALAATISSALRNAILFRSEQWRHQVADSFRNVIGLISSNIATDKLLSDILDHLNNNLPCQASAIWLLDKQTTEIPVNLSSKDLKLASTWGVQREDLQRVINNEPEVWKLLEMAFNNPEPTIRPPEGVLGPLGCAMGFPRDYSSISAPLKIGNTTLGLLTLAHNTSGRYGPEAKEMTMTFANYAAIAIHNSRLFSESQEQAWISTVLLQVAQTCQSSGSITDLLYSMARLTPLLVGINKCAFYTWDNYENHLSLKAEYGFQLFINLTIEKEIPAIYQLRQTLKPIFIQDPKEDLGIMDPFNFGDIGTLVLLPLSVRDEFLGAFLVAHASKDDNQQTNQFSNQTLSILQGISQQTAVTMDNLRLIEARQEEAYITAVLLQVAEAVVSQNNLVDTFETIVNLLPILIGVNACVIYLPEETDSMNFSAVSAFADRNEDIHLLKSTELIQNLPLLPFVQNTNQIAIAYASDNKININSWKQIVPLPLLDSATTILQDNMLIAYPVMIKDELLGILLTKEDKLLPQYFNKRIELLVGVSQEIALAIQNHKLQKDIVLREKLDQEMRWARQIQESFLPESIPHNEGWEIEARWETALQVGGDFYDVIPISNSKLGLVIADVADKGLAAALYMTVSRTLIRAFGQTVSDPAGVLKAVNNLLVGDTPSSMFVTAIFAMLDIKTGKLTYANAGHNLPLIFRASTQSVEEFCKGEMALGVIEDVDYKNSIVNIEPEDIILFYTDGLSEAFSSDNQIFGSQRIKELILHSENKSVNQTLVKIEEGLSDFRNGNPASDDLTMIVVKRLNQHRP